ncbi:MAG: nickel-dependent hydrogenase large subunit [Pseudomonadota bacterium]
MDSGRIRLEGDIRLSVRWDGIRVHQVAVHSSRPLLAASILEGKRPADAAGLVPRLFALCAGAQRACSEAALREAAGDGGDDELAWRRELDVITECALESLWRLTLDLPQTLGQDPEPMALSAVRRAFAAARLAGTGEAWRDAAATLRMALDRIVLGQHFESWLQTQPLEGLERWLGCGRTSTARRMRMLWRHDWGASGVPLMPSEIRVPSVMALAPLLRTDPDFPRRPSWEGGPRETGALAREQHHPLIAALLASRGTTVAVRWLARLIELTRLALTLERMGDERRPLGAVGSLRVAPGVGMAWVENARGLLIHWVEMGGERIARYVIVAPTEWNFHPDGPFVGALTGMEVPDAKTLERRARLLAQALDPCVAYRIEVDHA